VIAIIDYDGGNTRSVSNILYRCKINHIITNNYVEIKKSTKIILPGVANFSYCINNLKKKGLDEVLKEEVLLNKKLFLGICSGMQLLGTFSEEGDERGLDFIPAKIKKLPESICKIIPHVGWNKIVHNNHSFLNGIQNLSRFYFCHSYFFEPDDPSHSIIKTNYGFNFCAGVNMNNIFGIQFHPEKSLNLGKILINNFANLKI
tara:strand:- start:1600 stop:2208 length:609 start_codon:yes stop_codon:yes gene_type:complete